PPSSRVRLLQRLLSRIPDRRGNCTPFSYYRLHVLTLYRDYDSSIPRHIFRVNPFIDNSLLDKIVVWEGGVMKRLRLRLDDELKRRGMTQTQLIELTGMRPTTISEMVRNVRSRWDIRNIERVADALGIDPRDLIESYEE